MNGLPVCIKRFKPLEMLHFDPDRPVEYGNPIPKEVITDARDVIRLGEDLYKAEMEAWENRHQKELFDTVVQASLSEIEDVVEYLKTLDTEKAQEVRQKLTRLVISWKAPVVPCIMKCLESIYLKGGMSAVREVRQKLGC